MERNGAQILKTEATGLELLSQRSARGAAHDSAERFPPARCHPSTRRSVVGDALRWFHQRPSTENNVLWLHGEAGAGKTALAQTICECLVRTRHLGASFFLSRTAADHGRDDATCLFSTIACQLSAVFPNLAPYIEAAVLQDPAVVDKPLAVQFQKLVLEPLRQVEMQPVAIVIDGLDECSNLEAQVELLELLGSSFSQGHQLSFIITSRPLPHISHAFAEKPLGDLTHVISLAQSSETDRDIRAYLSCRFADIREDPKHRSTMAVAPSSWPGDDTISHLVAAASGLFLHAATVIRLADEPEYQSAERLSLIASLCSLTNSPLPIASLDTLYSRILALSPDRKRMLDTLGTIIAMQNRARDLRLTWSPGRDALSVAEKLLDLHEDDGYAALRPIRSLVAVREPAIGSKDELDVDSWPAIEGHDEPSISENTEAVRFYHSSLIDFLCSRSRAGEYFVDMEKLNTRLALACLRRLESLSLLPKSRINDVTWGYSLLYWTAHVTAASTSSKVLLEAIKNFDIVACYISTLTNEEAKSAVTSSVKPLSLSPKNLLQSLQWRLWSDSSPRPSASPNPSDITRARDKMLRTSARYDIDEASYSQCLQKVAAWLQMDTNSTKNVCIQVRSIADVLKHHQPSRKSR